MDVCLRSLLDYNPDTGKFTWKVRRGCVTVGSPAGTYDKDGYRIIVVSGKHYRCARLAWFFVYGVWPEFEIDHRNRIRDDDRIKNLRPATVDQNRRNCRTRKDNFCGVKGVYLHKQTNRWHARIRYRGRTRSLGYFDTLELAAEFRELAEAMVYEDFRS